MTSGPAQRAPPRKQRAPLPALLSGRYLPIEELGSGALGEVYLARDTTNDEKVAVKVMRSTLLEKEKARTLMANEAKALEMLDHPGIPKLLEFREGDRPYTVMEYVNGVPLGLGVIMKRTRRDFVRLCIDVCDILGEIHGKGIVHRDIKPTNILVHPHSLKLAILDYTHSKVPGRFDFSESSPAPMGTPAFMSPEQTIRGAPVDRRSDIYSFGVLMYVCLSGSTPFIMKDSPEDIMKQHRLIPPVPLELVDSSIPRSLSMIVDIAMNKMPQDRYPTAMELRKALERLI